MKRAGRMGAAAVLAMLTWTGHCAAQDRGMWRANSSTANSITGDIEITDAKLTVDLSSFAIAQIRILKPAEVAALFNSESTGQSAGNLYRLSVPGTKRFLHKNSLCGAEETRWMATFAQGRALHVAFFSGASMPEFTFESLQSSTDLCGTFSYAR